MTKKQNARNAKPATEAKPGAYEWLTGVLSALPGGFEIPQSARELVTRGAASAKERVSAAHEGANNIVGGVESILVGAAIWGFSQQGGYATGSSRGRTLALAGVVGAILTGIAPSVVNLLFKAAAA